MAPILRLTLAVTVFIVWIVLLAYVPDIAGLAMGVLLAGFGLVGLARRRITTRGKVGPYRTYVGWKAILPSSFFLVSGAGVSAYFACKLWPSSCNLTGR